MNVLGAIATLDIPDLTVILNTFRVILVHVATEGAVGMSTLSTISARVLQVKHYFCYFRHKLSVFGINTRKKWWENINYILHSLIEKGGRRSETSDINTYY